MNTFSSVGGWRRAIAGLVPLVLLVFASAGSVEAKYVDRSGELAGTTGATIGLLGAAAAGLVAYLVWSKSRDPDPKASMDRSQTSQLERRKQVVERMQDDPRFEYLWHLEGGTVDETVGAILRKQGGRLFQGN